MICGCRIGTVLIVSGFCWIRLLAIRLASHPGSLSKPGNVLSGSFGICPVCIVTLFNSRTSNTSTDFIRPHGLFK